MATAYEAGLLREQPSRLVEVGSGEGANAAPRAPQLDLQADLLSHGIVYRTVYAATALEDPDVLFHAWKMVELGEQARVLPSVPVKLPVVDGRRAMLPLTSSDTGGYCAAEAGDAVRSGHR